VVCAWLGNSRAVAQDHYLQVTDAHFAQAIAEPPKRPEEAAQNPAQSGAVTVGNDQDSIEGTNEDRPDLPGDTSAHRCLHSKQVTPTGIEPVFRP
jgi:hypothetical protein